MAKQYKVLVNTGKAENNKAVDVQQFSGDKGQPVRIKAQAGAKYQLQEMGRGKPVGPDYIKAKRVGKDLHILFENENEASLIIEDYYGEMAPGYNGVIGQAENGSFYEYIPEDPRVPGLIPELAEGGRAVNVALGGTEVNPVGAAVALAALPLLGPLGLLGAGAAAAAIAATTGTGTTQPGTTGALQAVAPNDSGTLGDNRTNDRTPTLVGTAPAGSTATVTINGQTYPVTINPDGSWSFTQPTNLPDGTYTPVLNVTTNGVTTSTNLTPFTIDASISSPDISNPGKAGTTESISGTAEAGSTVVVRDANGNIIGTTTAGPDGKWSITPSSPVPAGTITATATDAAGNTATDTDRNSSSRTALTIDTITDDNVLLASEQGASTYTVTGKVTGTFAAGDRVTLVLNGVNYAATVDANGNYSVPVAMTDLKADPDTKIEARISATGGDTATAAQDYSVEASNTATQTVLSINPVTADNILSATENTGSIAITGKVTGKFAAGDTVTLTVNNKTFTGAAAANGTFSISVPASDLAADSDTQVDGSVTGTGGSAATAIQNYGVDSGTVTPTNPDPNTLPNTGSKTTIAIDPVTGDNVMGSTDTGTINVTGKVGGSFATGDTVTLYVNGKSLTGTVAAGGTFSIAVPATDLLADKDTKIEAEVTGTNGDRATAEQNYIVEANPAAPTQTALSINTVTADNFLSASENTGNIPVTGTVTGKFAAGDLVTLQINGKVFTGTAAANGTFTISVPASDLAADSDTTIQGSVFGTGGSAATAIQNYGVDSGTVTPTNVDTTPPTIVVERLGSGTVNSSETVRFTLSEASTTFNQADITVTGGTLSNFTPVPTSGAAGSGYTQYTATFTPTSNASGTATIGVAAGRFTDNAGNQNLDTFSGASPTVAGQIVESNNLVSIDYNTVANPTAPTDTTAPSIIVARAGTANLASGNTELITFTLSENSSNFSLADIDVSGGTLSGFAPVPSSGTASTGYHQYTAVFTPAANSVGTATIGVSSGKFTDAANNANTDTYASGAPGFESNNQVSIGYNTQQPDSTAPSVVVSRAGSGTVTSSETIYFTLSEASTTFTQGDIDVAGGTLSNFTPVASSGTANGGYTQYTATFTPTANSTGTATIGVASGKFTDAAGNNNTDTYLTPAPAGATTEANNQVSLSYNTSTSPNTPDTTAPTIAISADKATLTVGQTAQLSFVLSEASSDFAQNDVQVSGGTLSNWVQISPTQYTATFTPTAGNQGAGSVSVASNTFRDAALNFNADGADANNTVNFITNYGNNRADTTAPTIAIARMGQGTLTSSETITFTLSEASTTFDRSDIDVTGGTLSNLTPVPTSGTAGSGYTEYTATFTPTANSTGTATIGVAAGKFTDNAGNQNLDTYAGATSSVAGQTAENNNLVSIVFNTQANPNPPTDSTPPTIVVERAGTHSLASGNTELITFTLSENSSNFSLADIDVSGGTLSGFAPVPGSGTASTGYHQYTAVFTPATNSVGTATIGVVAGRFTDAAGNANQDDYRLSGAENLNNQVVIAYNTRIADSTPPSIEVSRAGSGTVTGSETIYFTLSEASTTFTQGDIDVSGGTLSNFTPVPSSGTANGGYTQYTATFTPTANSTGTATIGVASGKFTDTAGNNNLDTYLSPAPAGASTETNNQVSLNYNTSTSPNTPDTTAPTIAISADRATLAAGQSATVTFVLSEPSTDFASGDVQVSGGTLTGWTQINPTTYTATFNPATGAQGTGSVSVGNNAFRDAAGNANTDGADANNTVNFITNNGNNGGDMVAPTIVVARSGSGTLTSSETLTFTLSEASTNFTASDIDVTGGTLSNFSPVPTSGTPGTGYTQYTATFTPNANASGNSTIGVAADKFSDNAGNFNLDDYRLTGAENANNQVTIAYNTQANPNPPTDTTAPSIAVSRAGSGNLASGGTETITFTLSENSSSFTVDDITVVGGTLSNFAPVTTSGSAATGYHQYTATFVPTVNASGTATIGVAAGKFTDAAGNANTDTYVSGSAGFEANNLVTIGYNTTQTDNTAPTIAVTRAGSGTVGSGGETIYFTLSEASTTFTLADIDVTGGTVTNLVPVASSASGTGHTQYTATFTPSANSTGTATIGVSHGKFSDLAGNVNKDTFVNPVPAGTTLEADNQISLSYNTQTNPVTPDSTPPTVAVTIDKTTLTPGQSAVVTFTLSEASTTFAQGDVDVTGGALSGWTQVSPSVYTATFTPTANTAGTATIGVKSGTFSDAAGNLNLDTWLSPAPAGASTESNNLVSVSYNAIPTDTTAPSIIVSRTNTGTTLAAGANETVTFKLSEASLDFDASDVAVTGGTLSNFTPVPTSGTPGTGYTEYTATFTPNANSSGTATIGVAAGRFSDNAGNKNTDTYISGTGFEADNKVSIGYNTVPPDTTAPKVALSRKGSGSLTAGGNEEISFVLSETSTTFTLADIDVVGGTLTNFAPVLSSGDATRGYTDYTATFTPSANSSGLARIGVQSGKFTDAAGNANLDTYLTGVAGTTVEANNVLDIAYNTTLPDTTAPTIAVSRAGAGMVSASETIYFTLSEASTSLSSSDIDVQGGTLSGFTPVLSSGDATNGYTQYTAIFTPTANSSGVATVGVKSGTFTDMAGNNNTDTYVNPAPTGASYQTDNQVSLNFNTLVPDTSAPTIAIDRSGTGPLTGPETLTFTLSEPSTNFIANDVDVSGGTLSNFQPVLSSGNVSSGYTQYTATFTPTANTVGMAWVGVASGKFTDASSNANLDTYLTGVTGTTEEANNIVEFKVNTDVTAPTVAIARASGATTQTFTSSETINITLSEASTDFALTDLAVSGGTLSNFQPVNSSGNATMGYTQYTVTFTPTAGTSGTATISVAHNTFSDAGGNFNRDSGTNPAPSGAIYEPNNLISAPFNTDTTAPTVAVTRSSGATSTVTGAESITFTFSEAINPASFDANDIDTVGGTIGNLQPDSSSGTPATGYTRYTATFTPTNGLNSSGSVGILANKFTDVAGNANTDSYALTGAENTNNRVSFNVNTSAPDTTPPTIAITRAGAGTVTGAETIFFTLSEASSDFTSSDIDVNGGSLSNFQQSLSNPLVYTATFIPDANSTATASIGVAAGKFRDAANNLNLDTYTGAPTSVAGQVVEDNNRLSLNVNTDTTAPTIVVGRQGTGPVTGPITVTFTLSEASTDFGLNDIDVVGGTLSNLQGSGNFYTATFTPTSNAVGTGSVGVASGKFSDAGGNLNKDTYLTGVSGATTEADNQFVFQFSTDTTPPTIALSRSGAQGATFTGPETITFTLSEVSSDFVWNGSNGDIVVNGGTLNALTQSSTNPLVYTATFTPNANASGTASISVASNRFSDSAGNFNQDGADANNTISAPYNTVPVDTTPPTIAISRANGNTIQSFSGAETIQFEFSEPITATSFATGDIDTVGGSITNLQPDLSSGTASGGYTRFTATFTPTTAGTVSVGVAASRFADAAGNNNVDTYITGTGYEANNVVSATYVPPATNATATIDILGMTTDAGTSASDFRTNDRSLSFNGSITNWVSINGDRVMLEVIDSNPLSGTFSQVLTKGFATPAANGTWTWTDTNTNRLPDTYSLKATIVSATGETPINSTAPANVNGNQTNGGWDTQLFVIDTTANNSDINLGVSIRTDGNNDTWVTSTELANASTFTARATFNSAARAGDKIAFSATNDGTALTPTTVTLTQTDIDNGWVETTFSKPAEGKTQTVTANYVDAAGNAATDTAPTDSARLDTTAPTNTSVGLAVAISTDGNNDALVSTAELNGASTFTSRITVNNTAQVGDKVVISATNGSIALTPITRTLSANDIANGFDVTFTAPANGATQTVTANYVDAAGNAATDTAPTDSARLDTTAPTNTSVGLAVAISTDGNNDALVSTAELNGASTFTSRITVNNTAQVGDKVVISATNGSTALTPITRTLSANDIANGFDVTFTAPANGATQTVTANYVDAAGNAATDTAPTDSARLDTTAPTNTSVGLAVAISTDGNNDALVSTAELNGASTFTSRITVNNTAQVGDKVVISATNGSIALTPITRTLSANDIANGFDVTFTAPANGATQTVTANYVDAAGNAATDTAPTDSARLDTTAPTNTSVGLAVAISTDGNNDALVSTAELNGASTFTSRITVNNTAQVGDKVVISATNGSTALTPITRTLSANDIANGFDVTFTAPANGATQTVTANYVDAAGNAATDTAPTDSARLDTTAPTNTSVGLAVAISTDGNNDALVSTAELNGASTFTSRITVNNTAQVGDKVVISATNGSTALTPITRTLSANDIANGFDVTFTAPADGTTQTVTANYVDAAGNAATDTAPTDTAALMLANNTTAIIDITSIVDSASTSSDTGTSAADFVTSDQTLTYRGTVTGWVPGLGDRVMLQLFDSNNNQLGSNVFVTPNSDGSWSWNDTANTRAAGNYNLRATIVSATGTTAINTDPPINGTGGGYDDQTIVIDTGATNADVSLAVQIRTDADNNAWVSANELGSSSTFTARATFTTGAGSSVRAGDRITFAATNDGSALSPVTVTLTQTDVNNGYVETTFATPADGKQQVVTARYTDLAGNQATGTVTDSASLDVTAPTIAIARTDSSGTVVNGVNTLTTGQTGIITITLSEAPVGLTAADLVSSAGGTIGAVTATADPKVFTVQYTPPTNGQGVDIITVANGVITDIAGNSNRDTYLVGAASPLVYEADNQISIAYDTQAPQQTVTLSSMTKDSGTSGSTINRDWTTNDGSAGRLLSGFISAPLGAGEVVKVYGGANGTTYLGDATVAPGGTTWTYTDTNGYTANWRYNARVVDAAGNLGATVSADGQLVTLVASSVASPVISTVQDVNNANATVSNGGNSSNNVFTLSGTGVAGSTVYVYDNTRTQFLGEAVVQSNNSWTLPSVTMPGAGTQNFYAYQIDGSGNVSNWSNTYTITSNSPNIVQTGGFTNTTDVANIDSAFTKVLPPPTDFTTIYSAGQSVTWADPGYIGPDTRATMTTTPTTNWASGTAYAVRAVGGDRTNWEAHWHRALRSNGYLTGSFDTADTDTAVWRENVSVVAGQSYNFSFDYWITTINGANGGFRAWIGNDLAWEFKPSGGNNGTIGSTYVTYNATTTGQVQLRLTLNDDAPSVNNGSDFYLDDVYFVPVTAAPPAGGLTGNVSGASNGTDSNLTLGATDRAAVGLDGDDTITASSTNLQARLASGTLIDGGAGIDTLKLAAGTTLNLASLSVNQTVRPIQEIEVIQMQGTSSLTLTANNVLSLGGAASTMGSNYTFASTIQEVGATGSTSSAGKVQMVVHGIAGDTLNLQALANDGVNGTGSNATILGNSSLTGAWAYMGNVTLTDVQGVSRTYKVYNHSTTGAQVLADLVVAVNTLVPLEIGQISDDTGASASDFVTRDQLLSYTGTAPILAAGEKVRVQIVNPANQSVIYEGDAVLNGTNWTFDRTAAGVSVNTLPAGTYTIRATIVDASNNPVASYGNLGLDTQTLVIDTGTPTVAVTNSGTGNTRTITFTLSEASTTFDASDVDVTGGVLSNFAADTTTQGANGGFTRYTATFTATPGFSGTATVGVLNNKFSDIAGNANLDTYTASPTSPVVNDGNNQTSFTVDSVPPTVAISANQLYLNSSTNTATVTFTFSERVVQGSSATQFDLSDVVVSGGTITGLTPVAITGDATNGYTQYTATFTAATSSTADGFIGIQNGKFADAAGNANIDTYVAGVAGTVQQADNAVNLPINTTTTVQAFRMDGGVNYALAGFDLHTVGDVNGDGREDFMIGTRGVPSGYLGAAAVPSKSYVVFGAPGLDLQSLNLTGLETAGNGKGFVVNGTSQNDYRPTTTGNGGFDYNGDGLADIVVNNNEGKSYVVYGKANTTPVNLSGGFQASDGFSITAPAGRSSEAYALGDINGDGYVDTFVQLGYTSTTYGYVLLGSASMGNQTIPASATNTGSFSNGFYVHAGTVGNSNGGYWSLGLERAPVTGDFNGDGFTDFAVQEYNWNSTGGAVDVVFGGSSNLNTLAAGDNNTSGQLGKAGVGFQVTGFTRNDSGLGIVGTSTGDINGDGRDDLILNNLTATGSLASSIYVAFGKTSTTAVSINTLASGSSTDGFRIHHSGWGTNASTGDVDVVGDFNGDGLDDVVVTMRHLTNEPFAGSWLVYGKTNGASVNLGSLSSTDGFRIGTGVNDITYDPNPSVTYNANNYGVSASAAGDVNGDGFADLLVSDFSQNATSGSTTIRDAGSTWLVMGGQFPSGSPTVFSAGSGDALGTTGNDALVGTSGNNQIVAGLGNDTLTGNGGADVLYGGAGNDAFVLNASNVAAFANTGNGSQNIMKVNGGTGIDTLRLDGSGITLDLTAITRAEINHVEVLDLTGSGNNTLRLNLRDVLELGQSNVFNVDSANTDTRVQLMVTGNSGDAVQLTDLANWSQPVTNNTFSFGGSTYNVYHNQGAQLLIDQQIVNNGGLS